MNVSMYNALHVNESFTSKCTIVMCICMQVRLYIRTCILHMHARTHTCTATNSSSPPQQTWDKLFFRPTLSEAVLGQLGDLTREGGRLVREEREGASFRGVRSSLEGDGLGVCRSGTSGRTAGPGDIG